MSGAVRLARRLAFGRENSGFWGGRCEGDGEGTARRTGYAFQPRAGKPGVISVFVGRHDSAHRPPRPVSGEGVDSHNGLGSERSDVGHQGAQESGTIVLGQTAMAMRAIAPERVWPFDWLGWGNPVGSRGVGGRVWCRRRNSVYRGRLPERPERDSAHVFCGLDPTNSMFC